MASKIARIVPNLWYSSHAEEAANFYVSIFPNSNIGTIERYGKAGHEIHGMDEGMVMTIEFTLDGQDFLALNGGPVFQFNEAISFIVNCDTQEEADYYWEKLSEGGDPSAQQCCWLKDKYGVSWQVVPIEFNDLFLKASPDKKEQLMEALLSMKKIDIPELRRVFNA